MKTIFITIITSLLFFSNVSAFQVYTSYGDAACGYFTGWMEVDGVNGAVYPITYAWSTGATTFRIDQLPPGVYTVTVTDAVGDTSSVTNTISNVPALNFSSCSYIIPGGIGGTQPCTNQCNGIAYLDPHTLNGAPPYSIAISGSFPNLITGTYSFNGDDYPMVSGICANDNFSLIVTDANGCSGYSAGSQPFTPNSFAVTTTIAPACGGNANGGIYFDFYGGSGFSYTLHWSSTCCSSVIYNFNEFASITNVLADTFTISVSEDLAVPGCDTTFTVIIPDLGANCGEISGNAYLDTIRNCVQDAGEPALPSRMVQFTPGPYYATTDATGNYSANLPFNTYSATLVPATNFTNVCSASGLVLNAANDTLTGIALADSANLSLDLSFGMTAGHARPGFDYLVYGTVHNNSYLATDTVTIVLNYDPLLTLVGASWPYTSPAAGQLILTAPAGVSAFWFDQFLVTFNVPSSVSIGTALTTSATASVSQPETNLSNNFYQLTSVVSGSFDPNEKEVSPAVGSQHTFLMDVDSILKYTIYFQNTGNDTAFNIVVVDTLSSYLNISSFEFTGSSHPARWEISGANVLKVYFDTIYLPDSTTNEEASHGVFSFSIRPLALAALPPLPVLVNNIADIYFDFNAPVSTNLSFVNLDISVGVKENEAVNNNFTISPNPAKGNCIIYPAPGLTLSDVRISDVQGRMVKNIGEINAAKTISLEKLDPGVYFVKGNVTVNGSKAAEQAVKRIVVY